MDWVGLTGGLGASTHPAGYYCIYLGGYLYSKGDNNHDTFIDLQWIV
jgi:hypothetical protein